MWIVVVKSRQGVCMEEEWKKVEWSLEGSQQWRVVGDGPQYQTY